MVAYARALSLRLAIAAWCGWLVSFADVAIGRQGHFASAVSACAAEPAVAANRRIGPFELTDVAGKSMTRDDWRAAKTVLLFFIGTECPASNGYTPQMERIARRYSLRGVQCLGVHSDPTVTADAAAAHAKEYRLTFTILLDPAQTLAQASGVRVTPEAVVASSDGRVLYRGRIDNRYALDGKRRDEATQRDLEDALEAILSGAEPPLRETKAFGCPLPKPRPGQDVN